VAQRLREVAPNVAAGRVIVAHLGSGASMCALHHGRSVETTMGFTALDGICMGTRPGSVDPGVILYLFQTLGLSPKEVETMLYKQCGLLGISGISNDMRDLVENPTPAARLAVDYFVYQAAKQIGALAAVLQGVDALVFTAGIGERSSEIRRRICDASAWLGVTLDPVANAKHGPRISTTDSRVSAWVIPTNEELMIARHTGALLGITGRRVADHGSLR
jgi:acetate kinase